MSWGEHRGGLESESWRSTEEGWKARAGGGLESEGWGWASDSSDPPGRRQKKEGRIPVWDTVLVQVWYALRSRAWVCDREGLLLLAGGLSVLHLLAELGEGVEVSEGRLLCGGRGGGALIDLHV